MDSRKTKKITQYWQKTAEHDYETMLVLFKSKRYSDALFFGHMVLEKILKAHVVQNTKKQAPYLHDLVRLAKIANLEITEGQLDVLDIVNDFNIRARYPEYKLEFYKKCTKKYTQKHLENIKILYKILCQRIK